MKTESLQWPGPRLNQSHSVSYFLQATAQSTVIPEAKIRSDSLEISVFLETQTFAVILTTARLSFLLRPPEVQFGAVLIFSPTYG